MKNLNLFHRDLPTHQAFTIAGAPSREAHVWLKRQLSHLGERISERKRVFSPMEAVELGIFSRLVLLSPPSSTARWSREIAAHIEKMVRASKEDTIAGWAAKRLGDDPAIHAIHVAYELDGTITCWPMSQFEKSERDAYNRGAFPATYIGVWGERVRSGCDPRHVA